MDWHDRARRLYFTESKSWTEIAYLVQRQYFPQDDILKVKERVRTYIRGTPEYKIKKSDSAPICSERSSIEYKENGQVSSERIISIAEATVITPELIISLHGLDVTKWTCVSYKNNYWQQQKKGGTAITLYQSKLVVKPKAAGEISLQEIKSHFESFQKSYIPRTLANPIKNDMDKMYEINLADLHLGKLCWNRESGESYDYKIARERFFKIINAEAERIKKYPYEKILFVWCNDFFNADGMSNTTTGGTVQSVDIRWQKMFLVGCEMLVQAIDMLSQYAPVETFYIASNHSRQVEFYAINYLFAWFKDNPNVTIDLNCKARYYYQYGVTLLGFSHSYYEKKNNLPFLMSVEAPEMWAKSTYREYHLGHEHSERVEEKGGVVFRWLPSVTGTDGWHYDSGYVGAFKRSYSFVWDKYMGLEAINCTNISI